MAVLAGGTLAAGAAIVPVPNGSFESPATTTVDTRLDAWQRTPRPFWWDEQQFGSWDQLIGVFANLPPEDSRHIVNCDGNQAIWLFANPEVGLFQDRDSTNGIPGQLIEARFEPGKSYRLTVGLLVGKVYAMAEGATLELSLYYRDVASNRVTVAATTVTNTAAVFNSDTNLIDFQVSLPEVTAGDPWAGKPIGVSILSTVDLARAGGYWDIDNVRLTAHWPPVLLGPVLTNGHFGFRVEGDPGQRLEIQSRSSLSATVSNWTSLGVWTNDTGALWFSEPVAQEPLRVYRARQLP